MAVLPIPTTRVTDQLASLRLVGQLQSDQADLFRVQTQISTGLRIFRPSDDAPAALRAMNLQRLIERKTQLESNVSSASDYLTATDDLLGGSEGVTTQLNTVRSAVLGVVDTISTETDRDAAIEIINGALFNLSRIANSQFEDRYLFSGTRSLEQPFVERGTFYEYTGNEQSLRSHVDLNLLFDTGVPGTSVFGGISAQIEGTTDFDPQLTSDTLLRDINGGAGLSSGGAVEVVYVDTLGNQSTSVVSLETAATVGDVARYIEQFAPEDSELQVRVTSSGFELSVPSGGVFIREVAEGSTANELGLLGTSAVSNFTGRDISPAVLNTTPLDDLFGRRAQALLTSAGDNNDIIISATTNGAAAGADPLNGVTISFTDTGTAGAETATYNAGMATLEIAIESGESTAAQVVAAINAEASGLFTAQLDPGNSTDVNLAGTGLVTLSSTAVTSGGGGTNFDRTSGLIVTNGGTSEVIDFVGAETVEDLLNRLNHTDLGLQVEINDSRTGINIRSRLSGADLTIGENGGSTAAQLGIRSYTTDTQLADLNRGVGIPNSAGDGLTITVDDDPAVDGDGTSFFVDLDGAFTIGDVIDRINSAPDNTGLVTADLTDIGNGIRLTDNTGATNDLVVRSEGPNQAGHLLGFIDDDASEGRSATGVLVSEDRNTVEVDGVFNTLLRMRTALENNDITALGRELDRLDADHDRVTFARSEVGARLQGLEVLEYNLQDEQVNLKAALSEEIDVDLTAAISEFTNRQYALEASLRTASSILRMSLLDFL